MNLLRFLLLEDSYLDAELIETTLAEGGIVCELIQVQTHTDFLTALKTYTFDLILADYSLPTFDGMSALKIVRNTCPAIPFIFVSGSLGEELAIESLQHGATDYVLKQRLGRLVPSVQRALREVEERRDRSFAQARMRQSETRFRLIVESAQDYAIITLDMVGSITSWNSGAQRLLGYEEVEILGQPGQIIFTAEDIEQSEPIQEMHLALTQGRQENERWHVRKDGSRFWGSGVMMPLRDGADNIEGFLKIMQDKTQQRQAEQMLQQQAEQLRRANQLKDEFLAVLSHELRTPLNPILGWAKLLPAKSYEPAIFTRGLETIARNAQILRQLIEDLLDVSRILSGKLKLSARAIDLTKTIKVALETVQMTAEAKSISIQTQIQSDIGYVFGDSDRLQQVLWNLLSNAIKFTPSHGRVEIALKKVNTQVQIQVADNGTGISPEFLPYVFERFRQADGSTTRQFGGLGLGLAIARHLIELHGGTIQAHSLGEGQGATFTICLPQMPTMLTTSPTKTQVESNTTLSNLSILLVEDELDTLDFLKFLLEQSGATVTAVSSAKNALQVLEQHQPDLLVSDIGMPEMDGYMLIQHIRSQSTKTIPAIALTAYAGELAQERSLLAGFQKHLAKPIEPTAFITAIADLVDTKLELQR
ncbi:response regulator [Nostocaceae cyanobacterium CENA369]|uniref:Circadian input-output histidine kinase CikA n=1 Tax=Dendronalium phyllosphericum CENA369 TaxID=1725256 RepID=A0A8J7IDC0_9NOST|nr:response regulator [Dendronalium phyllosphericum]MBH8575207.1 response regulator [Dendronalium phyllosphericum CENA369]